MIQRVTGYKLNVENAKRVGNAIGIEEKGDYVGVFTRAEMVQSERGTQGIEFDFVCADGRNARYLTVWTVNADGKELHGRKIVDAIMTCIGVRGIEAAEATIKKWNPETRAEENTRAIVFPDLMNKPIGVVLVREEYESNDGGRKWKNALMAPFEAATRRTAAERLDNTPAEMLDKILMALKDRQLKTGGSNAYNSHSPDRSNFAPPSRSGGSGFDDMDDDIPF